MARNSKHVRHFQRIARERLLDARCLLKENRNTGAIYLAGDAVECVLKALWLSEVSKKQEAEINATFRGVRSHSLNYLRHEYLRHGGRQIERNMVPVFVRVDVWNTNMRYVPGLTPRQRAERFVAAVIEIAEWAERRI